MGEEIVEAALETTEEKILSLIQYNQYKQLKK